jgi:hypothetical protein
VLAQVSASHAPRYAGLPDIEVASPLQLDVSLAATTKHPALIDQDERTPIVFSETRQYVCDKARVMAIQVWHKNEFGGKVRIKVVPSLSTDWMRQDLNVVISLVHPNGKEIAHRAWRGFTVGSEDNFAAKIGAVWASRSKNLEAEFVLPRKDLEAMFVDGKAPSARVWMEIVQ